MKIKISSSSFLKFFSYLTFTSLWECWIFWWRISGKKCQLAHLSWAICNCPTSNRVVLIYTSEDHTIPHNHTVILWAYFHWVFPLNQSSSLSHWITGYCFSRSGCLTYILCLKETSTSSTMASVWSRPILITSGMLPDFVHLLQWLYSVQ